MLASDSHNLSCGNSSFIKAIGGRKFGSWQACVRNCRVITMFDTSNTDHSSEGEIRVKNKNLKIDAASGVPANEDLRDSGIALCECREFPDYDLVSTRDVSNTHDPTVLEQQAAFSESKSDKTTQWTGKEHCLTSKHPNLRRQC